MVTQKVLRLQPREDFVLTPAIENICRRALTYLDAGYACHFRGSAGTGKTTLAMHVAHQRGRPVVLMFGDEQFGTSDLVGAEKGMHSTRVTDNFVRSVTKTEEFRRPQWVDNRLTTACKHGYTLVVAELPGVGADRVSWDIADRTLTLRGHAGDRRYFRTLRLREAVDPQSVVSCYENGVLQVKLWKQRR